MGKIVAGVIFLVSGWLFMQLAPPVHQSDSQRFEQNINLALRRTAHHLLTAAGDSTSGISPVQHPDAVTYSIRLERAFDYDQIPDLLHESLHLHGVQDSYDVAVLDCADGVLRLGYSHLDLKEKAIPCVGRQQEAGCRNLLITFKKPSQQSGTRWWAGLFGFLLAGISGLVWYRVARSRDKAPVPASATDHLAEVIQFGRTTFHPADQSLNAAGVQHPLTYRETKLLRLFATHPNQLLERELILKLVWEDEGIIVGRSVDVFVSRLRKLLRSDPTVSISSVHGVGYRLEVTDQES
ncbi:helix-turn-helix domain-containing protein [Persicitalea jodogahamensis]|uniref:OmpR/PhoB-type domain-containing protein n=1 Tax=Persicitalea jodogahamensis TaxID=402147 RepID=A0A8J3D323_9BACT|nr:helix-turn-helix domain-containing protein [Persicitalea jodogahamensis]GHB63046.1 hypothetical protein GCM10007390_16100 [Persicitalea jodogahamensis]